MLDAEPIGQHPLSASADVSEALMHVLLDDVWPHTDSVAALADDADLSPNVIGNLATNGASVSSTGVVSLANQSTDLIAGDAAPATLSTDMGAGVASTTPQLPVGCDFSTPLSSFGDVAPPTSTTPQGLLLEVEDRPSQAGLDSTISLSTGDSPPTDNTVTDMDTHSVTDLSEDDAMEIVTDLESDPDQCDSVSHSAQLSGGVVLSSPAGGHQAVVSSADQDRDVSGATGGALSESNPGSGPSRSPNLSRTQRRRLIKQQKALVKDAVSSDSSLPATSVAQVETSQSQTSAPSSVTRGPKKGTARGTKRGAATGKPDNKRRRKEPTMAPCDPHHGGAAPSHPVMYQGAGFRRYFQQTSSPLRTDVTGRVGKFKPSVNFDFALEPGQVKDVRSLCYVPSGRFICHFCPDKANAFTPWPGCPLSEDNTYATAEDLHMHVCLYHYPWVWGLSCFFCGQQTAVSPTWEALLKHLRHCHHTVTISDQSSPVESYVETLMSDEVARSRHLPPQMTFNLRFIPPRRLPPGFPTQEVANTKAACVQWAIWRISNQALACVPEDPIYTNTFVWYKRGAGKLLRLQGPISDRPIHKVKAKCTALKPAASVALSYGVLPEDHRLRILAQAAVDPVETAEHREGTTYSEALTQGVQP